MGNSPARALVDVGSVIADTYKIEGVIGRGGMGAVFVASHNRLPGKRVAIKLLHAELHEEEVLARFRREAEIASRLGHPNIVTVHDFNVTAEGMPYLVLEYLEGETLAQKIKNGPIPIEQVMSIVRQVGSALAAAHREGIVHRDLKPQNIFLIPTEVDGRTIEIAKVLDFGISKIRGSQTIKTQESTLLGTPQYMAPEQATGQHDHVDERTDVFALGAIVYEMLSGRPAFSGASIPEVVFKVVYEQPAPLDATLPPAITNAVKQAMSKTASERFSSVSGFVEALTGQPLTSFRPSAVSLPEVGFASGSKRVTNPDALANTMGSGDFENPRPAPVVPGVPVRGSSPTVGTESAPHPAPASAPVSPAPPARGRGGLIVAGVGCVAIAAAVMFFALRKDEPKPVVVASEPAISAPAADTVAAPVPEPAVPPTAVLGGAAEPVTPTPQVVETKPPATKPETKPVTKPETKPETKPVTKPETKPVTKRVTSPPAADPESSDEDASVSDLLRELETVFRGGDYEQALRLTKEVIRSPTAGPRQHAHAYAFRGMIACARRDLEDAKNSMRQLVKFPRYRQRMTQYCHAQGMLK